MVEVEVGEILAVEDTDAESMSTEGCAEEGKKPAKVRAPADARS